ncbi:MAG: hypothetical protein AAGG75_27190 [Bacteroidota bacterium]
MFAKQTGKSMDYLEFKDEIIYRFFRILTLQKVDVVAIWPNP